ncbi:right-handed parallel beta-helix repeat-containing protein [Thermodesulfobacteriota bacterium B35]
MADTFPRWLISGGLFLLACFLAPAGRCGPNGLPGGPGFDIRAFQELQKQRHQDRLGGLPPEILAAQGDGPIDVPTPDEAAREAIAIADRDARALIDRTFHQKGRTLVVPDAYSSIQAAIDAADAGDTVLVRPGTYHELLVMKDGVRLASDAAEDGDRLVPVKNCLLKLPRRTLRTIIDGSESAPSSHGMIDFAPGVGRKTIIDGFTIQNLPPQNHHIPGHAHALNVRGASPVIMNCLIRNNGSTGIGSHVVYNDQDAPMPERDFRFANIRYRTSALIYHNILRGNLGLGIGSNHFAEPLILGNEILANSDEELGGVPTPGIGNKHGSAATILGNIVHHNPGGGILCKEGAAQGRYPIDRSPHPSIIKNVVYDNGSIRPGISASACGSMETPVRIVGNSVFRAGMVGIGASDGTVAIIDDNLVVGSRQVGIAVKGATVLHLNRNRIRDTRQGPGVAIVAGSRVLQMEGNISRANMGPRFVAENGSFAGPAGGQE